MFNCRGGFCQPINVGHSVMICDHVVGYHGDVRLHESSVIQRCIDESSSWNKHQNILAYIRSKKVKKVYKPSDFLDRRKGYITMFVFCPYCASKIDWDKIKQDLKIKNDGINYY